jgi:hypothetical protein
MDFACAVAALLVHIPAALAQREGGRAGRDEKISQAGVRIGGEQ